MTLVYDANFVMSKIQRAYEEEVQKLRRMQRDKEEEAQRFRLQYDVAYDSFIKKCRKPRADEYAGWLAAYLMRPNSRIDEVLPTDFGTAEDYLLLNDEGATVTRLYGTAARRIIVPADREIELDSEFGDNVVYYCKDASVCCFNLTKPRVQIFRDVMGIIGAVAASAKFAAS